MKPLQKLLKQHAAPALSAEEREAADHDSWVQGYEPDTLRAMARDLCARKVHNRRDPAHRWIMSRRAAILRALVRMGISLQTI